MKIPRVWSVFNSPFHNGFALYLLLAIPLAVCSLRILAFSTESFTFCVFFFLCVYRYDSFQYSFYRDQGSLKVLEILIIFHSLHHQSSIYIQAKLNKNYKWEQKEAYCSSFHESFILYRSLSSRVMSQSPVIAI